MTPIAIASCRMISALTLSEIASSSRTSAAILADSRAHGLFDGLVTPIRAGYDKVGLVLMGADHLLELADHERFLLQSMCEAYATAGLALLPERARPPTLTRRETECLRWGAVGRSDPQIGIILSVSPNTVHAHVPEVRPFTIISV